MDNMNTSCFPIALAALKGAKSANERIDNLPLPLVISQTLTAGQTSITFSNAAILATSFISVASEAWYESVSQSAGSVTITFPAQASDMLVQIMVAN